MDQLALLSKLISIPSVFPNEGELSTYIEHYLRELGFRVERVMTGGRANLVATWGEGERWLGFYGHLDTVPPAKDYTRDPSEMVVDEEIARGLGVCDMKGGLSCILTAGKWAVSKGLPVKLVFGVDEEDISRGAHTLVDSGLLKDIELLVVAESGQIKNYDQPVSVVYGRKGRCVLRCEVKGMKAHAAEAIKGKNAIEEASHFVRFVSDMKLEPHTRLGATRFIVQEISAESDSFSVPDRCILRYSVLSSPGSTVDFSIRLLEELGKKHGIDVTVEALPRETPYGESYELPLENELVKRIEDDIIRPLGVPLYTDSVADENVFAHRLGIPVLTVGPIGGGDHTAQEWIRIGSLASVVELYKKMIVLFHERKG